MKSWIVWLTGVIVLFAAVRYVDAHKENLVLSLGWAMAGFAWTCVGFCILGRAVWRFLRG